MKLIPYCMGKTTKTTAMQKQLYISRWLGGHVLKVLLLAAATMFRLHNYILRTSMILSLNDIKLFKACLQATVAITACTTEIHIFTLMMIMIILFISLCTLIIAEKRLAMQDYEHFKFNFVSV